MSNPKKGQYRSDMKEIAASKIYKKPSGVESHAHEVLASRTLFIVRCIATASINTSFWIYGRKCCQL
jgi:hypothetical protein